MAKKKKTPLDDNKPKAKSDAYTGMLSVSLLALITGCILLFLDFQKYDFKMKAPQVNRVSAVGPDGLPADGGNAPPPAGNPPAANPPAGNPPPQGNMPPDGNQGVAPPPNQGQGNP
jgi:hypothetical protein